MDAFKGFLTSRKRKIEEEVEMLDRCFSKKRNYDEEEDTSDVLLAALAATGILGTRKERKQRGSKPLPVFARSLIFLHSVFKFAYFFRSLSTLVSNGSYLSTLTSLDLKFCFSFSFL